MITTNQQNQMENLNQKGATACNKLRDLLFLSLVSIVNMFILTTSCSSPAVTNVSPSLPLGSPVFNQSNVFRFSIGRLEAIALKDGDIDVPNDGKTFGIGQSTDKVAALLKAAGQPTDMLHLSIQPLLVRSDSRTLLFDSGAGDAPFARAGKLQDSLRASGVLPEQITDIFISHQHPDHIGGLLTREGKLAFQNATIHISAVEWETLKKDKDAATLVAAISAKVVPFQPGSVILPGLVTAIAAEGHTPGHSAYMISSGNERLLYIGDVVHHFVVSIQRPDWRIAWDEDASLAEKHRRRLLQLAADENLRVYAVHFPFPGLGRIKAQDGTFLWVPEVTKQN